MKPAVSIRSGVDIGVQGRQRFDKRPLAGARAVVLVLAVHAPPCDLELGRVRRVDSP